MEARKSVYTLLNQVRKDLKYQSCYFGKVQWVRELSEQKVETYLASLFCLVLLHSFPLIGCYFQEFAFLMF
jgi:hypothetical protein